MTSRLSGEGLVSVIMPFLNPRESFFIEAVESIQSQSYQNWELLLIDDGSNAECTNVARRFISDHTEQIRYLEHDDHANLGISASRNRGLEIAKGEFVAFLDADDTWDEKQLDEQVQILHQKPDVAAVYGNTKYWHSWDIDRHPLEQDFEYKMRLRTSHTHQPPEILKRLLQRRTITPCMTSVLVRRKVFDSGISFDEKFPLHYEDQVFFAQLLATYPVYVSGKTWGKYRIHGQSVTGDGDDSETALVWRSKYLHWLEDYFRSNHFRGTPIWRALKLEMWMFQSRRFEAFAEWVRVWRRRFRKLFGVTND